MYSRWDIICYCPYICRHPKAPSRPNFSDIVVALQHPDCQILKWSQKDIDSCENANARVLGSSLEDGYFLYADLQHAYKKGMSKVGDDVPQKQDQTPHES